MFNGLVDTSWRKLIHDAILKKKIYCMMYEIPERSRLIKYSVGTALGVVYDQISHIKESLIWGKFPCLPLINMVTGAL
jgi:hypothetical protein